MVGLPSIPKRDQLAPARYRLTDLRCVFLKGVGIAELWPQALILLLWGVGILTLAVAKFHKRLD